MAKHYESSTETWTKWVQDLLIKTITEKIEKTSFKKLKENYDNKEYLITEQMTNLPFELCNYSDFNIDLEINGIKISLITALVLKEKVVAEEILKRQLKEKSSFIQPQYVNRLTFYHLISSIEKIN